MAGYLVVLITVLSVADLVLPGLPVPDGLYRIIVIVLVAFIPVVVALSWFLTSPVLVLSGPYQERNLIRKLQQASAFRYKGSILATQDICRESGVESSVTGSINHYGNRLVVQAELVDAEQDSQIWGERYNAKW